MSEPLTTVPRRAAVASSPGDAEQGGAVARGVTTDILLLKRPARLDGIEVLPSPVRSSLGAARKQLTLRRATSESLGMERHLKANTDKRRTYSLFRQGCMYYQPIPNMPEHRLRPLLERFAHLLREQPVVREVFRVI
jgi:hypothetical protein